MVTETFPGAVPFNVDAPHRDMAIRGKGGVLGWYLGEQDGRPRRLPVHPMQRDRYESGTGGHRQRLIFKRDWGTYSPDGDLRLLPDGRTAFTPLEGKYEQLARLAQHFPEAKAALALMYAPRPDEHEQVWTCACGMEFTRVFAIDIHKESCPKHQAQTAPPPAIVAKPAVPITCKTCGDTFEKPLELANHSRFKHPKKKRDAAGRRITAQA